MNINRLSINANNRFKSLFVLILLFFTTLAYSVSGVVRHGMTFSMVTENVTGNINSVAQLIIAISYVGGIALFIAAIFKFKQHKENPTQITIGTPIALVAIAGSLLFLPGILSSIGFTAFTGGGETATSQGIIYNPAEM